MNKVLEELDNQEVHIRRLARRIDEGASPCPRIELRLSSDLHRGLEWLHGEHDAKNPEERGGYPWPGYTVVGRAKSQALAIVALAQEVEGLGGPIDANAIDARLNRARQAMPHRMEIWINEGPELIDSATLERDYFELIRDPQQEVLFAIDLALDEVIKKSEAGESA